MIKLQRPSLNVVKGKHITFLMQVFVLVQWNIPPYTSSINVLQYARKARNMSRRAGEPAQGRINQLSRLVKKLLLLFNFYNTKKNCQHTILGNKKSRLGEYKIVQ